MAERVIEVSSMFTGAETGASCLENLTTKQLDALINHKWPDPKNEPPETDPLKATIKNIKGLNEEKKPNLQKKEKLRTANDEGLESSRQARRTKLIAIGRKLRTQGKMPDPV